MSFISSLIFRVANGLDNLFGTEVEDNVRIIVVDPQLNNIPSTDISALLDRVRSSGFKTLLIDPGQIYSECQLITAYVTDNDALREGRRILPDDNVGQIILVVPETGQDYAYSPQQLGLYLAWGMGASLSILPAYPFPKMIERGTIIDCETAKVWIDEGKIPFLEKDTCTLADSMQYRFFVRQRCLYSECVLALAVGHGVDRVVAPQGLGDVVAGTSG